MSRIPNPFSEDGPEPPNLPAWPMTVSNSIDLSAMRLQTGQGHTVLAVNPAGRPPPWPQTKPGDGVPVMYLAEEDGLGVVWFVLHVRVVRYPGYAFSAYALYRIAVNRPGYCVGLAAGEQTAVVHDSTAFDLLRAVIADGDATAPFIDRLIECDPRFMDAFGTAPQK